MNKSLCWPSAENIIKAQEQHSCAMLRVRRWVIMLRFWTSRKNYMVPAADAAALVAMLEASTFDEILSIWRRPSVGILTTDDSGERIDHGRVRRFFWEAYLYKRTIIVMIVMFVSTR